MNMGCSLLNIDCLEGVWAECLRAEFEKSYMKNLEAFLSEQQEFFPPPNMIFNSFTHTPFENVKVVIMGQDPYHGIGQAHGLSFSVPMGVPAPPSLKNIFKELDTDLGISPSKSGDLTSWARQGVLLLNSILTVAPNQPKSHHLKGWEVFTDKVIELLCLRKDPVVFILWGKSAFDKFKKISSSSSQHCILAAPHPSPRSAYSGFFGCRHFSKANEFLKKIGKSPIEWELEK